MKYDRRKIKTFMSKYSMEYLDICIVTCHRLPYLQKCIWSIIASTSISYRIFVVDDQSSDGTSEFLKNMKDRGLIQHVLSNFIKLGTARSLNEIIDLSNSNWFVFTNDDMWFHRYWDYHAIDIVNTMSDCGMVSMFNYTASVNKKVTPTISWAPSTGLGATFMYRELWDNSPKFYMPIHKLMHFFSTTFCKALPNIKITRNNIYVPNPPDVMHMDLARCKLNERDYEDHVGYTDFRKSQKMMKSSEKSVKQQKKKTKKIVIPIVIAERVFPSKNIVSGLNQ